MASHQDAVEGAPRRHRTALAVGGAAVLIAAGCAVAIAASPAPGRPVAAHTIPAGARRGTAHRTSTHHRAPAAPVPLRVEATSPALGAEDVSYSPVVTVKLSAPLAAGSPLPSLSPAVPGTWAEAAGDELVFRATGDYLPDTRVRLTIPGGRRGLREAGGETLPSTVSSTFTVAAASVRRLQQLLAELGYLPVTFVPDPTPATVAAAEPRSGAATGGAVLTAATTSAIDAEPTVPDEIQIAPVAGHFAWRYPDTPASLRQLWSPDAYTVVTRGAVMAFEAAAGLTVDGTAGKLVWQALLEAVAHRRVAASPYAYIMVSQTLPETLTVWQAGKVILRFRCNTGIPQSPTQQGTFPVYERFLTTTMSGYNPNGSYYYDPGIPWVAYFNGGDAIHGFWRSAYGYPQSLGCVELVPSDAQQVWPYDQLGTLVTVD